MTRISSAEGPDGEQRHGGRAAPPGVLGGRLARPLPRHVQGQEAHQAGRQARPQAEGQRLLQQGLTRGLQARAGHRQRDGQ